VQRIAQDWLVLSLTGSATDVGITTAARQVTDTVILPPARPDSITRCASTMSSKPNTLAGLA